MVLRFSPSRGAASLSLNAMTRGPQGTAATLAVGAVTTLAPGATPTVANTGSSGAAVFAFGLPATPTIAVGTTTTKAAASSATVNNSGSTTAEVYDFGIPRGADAGMRYAFESSTSMAAPASGGLRLNNATLASVTALAVNPLNSDGVDISAWLLTWDDSTNTVKGSFTLRKEGSGAVLGIFTITSVVNNTTWLQINVTYVSGSGSLTAADPVYLTPYITGNAGSMSGPGSSVDNEIALFSGTGGATLKRASTTGILKGTSGVISAAAAGTDYVAPAGALGTPSSGTLTNCTGLPASGLVASTSQAVGFGTIELGAASDTTISRASAGVIAVEGVSLYSGIPLTSKTSSALTTVLADANTGWLHPTADNNSRTFTIDSNANVAYPAGTTLTFVNQINTVTIAITSDTLTLMGASSTGPRTLAANGMATALKVSSTNWVISGVGLT